MAAQVRQIQFGDRSPREIYGLLKASLKATLDINTGRGIHPRWLLKNDPVPAEYDCAKSNELRPYGVMLPYYSPQGCAVQAAMDALEFENDLRTFGIPSRVWQTYVTAWDDLGIKILASTTNWNYSWKDGTANTYVDQFHALEKALAKDLATYRAKHPGIPAFQHEGGFGAGEEKAEFVSNSAMTSLKYISFFHYHLCEAMHLIPEAQKGWVGWTTIRVTGNKVTLGPDGSWLNGVYKYVAKMPGGLTRRGEFLATPPPDFDKQIIQINP